MNDVPLRDFIERIIAENNLRRDDLRAEDRRWLERELKALSKALDLQAAEYERRLHILNHEAARILKAIEVTVSRDTWDGFIKGYVEWKGKLDLEHANVLDRLKNIEVAVSSTGSRIGNLEEDKTERGGRSKSFITIFASLSVLATIVTIGNIIYGYMK